MGTRGPQLYRKQQGCWYLTIFESGAMKRVVQVYWAKIVNALRNTAQVLKIIVLLHSAKDFRSTLRLYGIKTTSET